MNIRDIIGISIVFVVGVVVWSSFFGLKGLWASVLSFIVVLGIGYFFHIHPFGKFIYNQEVKK